MTTSNKNDPNPTLTRCIRRSGGTAHLAYALGLGRETVRHWRTEGRVCQTPAALLMALWFDESPERLTDRVLGNVEALSPERIKEGREKRSKAAAKRRGGKR